MGYQVPMIYEKTVKVSRDEMPGAKAGKKKSAPGASSQDETIVRDPALARAEREGADRPRRAAEDTTFVPYRRDPGALGGALRNRVGG